MTTSWFLRAYSALRSKGCVSFGPQRRLSRSLFFDRLEQRNLLSAIAAGDFNGDGVPDLAVGTPDQKVGTITGAGVVNVIYGAAGSGLTATNSETWNQDSPGVLDVAEVDDHFGEAVAAGDFNGDGYDDLAIGIPQQDVNGRINAGAVQVIFGSSGGLRNTGNQLWHQDTPGVLDDAESNDNFGSALTDGDFNNDGRADLAIGIPGESNEQGAIQILFGSLTVGLTSTGNRFSAVTSAGGSNPKTRFGSVLASGDLTCDDLDDLVIGVPRFSLGLSTEVGEIVIYFSGDPNTVSVYHQNILSIQDEVESGDWFGAAVAVGDFTNDGTDDVAIGVPGEDIGTAVDAGAVHVLQGLGGSVCTVVTGGNQFWTQDSASILDAVESNDRFGGSLQAGDFNGDGRYDLAIGAPGESLDSGANIVTAAGAVNVVYGSPIGLNATGNQFWNQDTSGVLGTIGPNEQFSAVLSAGDFDDDSRPDLVVSVSSEESCLGRTEAVNVLYASASGFTTTGNQLWRQISSGAFDSGEETDLQVHHGRDVLLIDSDGELNVATAHSTIFDSFSLWGTNAANIPPERYQIADFNGDNLSDVISFESDGALNVWTGKVGGGFNVAVRWGQNGADIGPERYKIGDFNGDGLNDVVSIESNGYFYVWKTKVGGGFEAPAQWNRNGADIGASRYKLGDFNGDGRTDVASFESNAVFYVWTANAAGNGFNDYQRWGSNGADIDRDRYQIGDFNGDHRADVVSFESNGGIYVWTANSNGSFNDFKRWGSNTGDIGAQRYRLADFDGDTRIDVISFETNGAMNVWTAANGDQFNNPEVWTTNGGDIGQERYRVGDVNGDGRADVASFEANGGIYVWLAKSSVGFVNFTRWGSFTATLLPNRFALADFRDPASSSSC